MVVAVIGSAPIEKAEKLAQAINQKGKVTCFVMQPDSYKFVREVAKCLPHSGNGEITLRQVLGSRNFTKDAELVVEIKQDEVLFLKK